MANEININHNCAICTDPMSEESRYVPHEGAGHAFHYKCLTDWLEQCYRNGTPETCPVCRYEYDFFEAYDVLSDFNVKPNFPNPFLMARPHPEEVEGQPNPSAAPPPMPRVQNPLDQEGSFNFSLSANPLMNDPLQPPSAQMPLFTIGVNNSNHRARGRNPKPRVAPPMAQLNGPNPFVQSQNSVPNFIAPNVLPQPSVPKPVAKPTAPNREQPPAAQNRINDRRLLTIAEIGERLIDATSRQDIRYVKLYLTAGRAIIPMDRGAALIKAIELGNLDLARLLRNSGPISASDRGAAMINAARIGNEEIFELCLENRDGLEKPFDQTQLDLACAEARHGGHERILKRLEKLLQKDTRSRCCF